METLGINSCFSGPNIPCGQLFSLLPIIILVGIRGMYLWFVLLHLLYLCISFGVLVRPFLWSNFWRYVTSFIPILLFLSINFLVHFTGTSQGSPTVFHCGFICFTWCPSGALGWHWLWCKLDFYWNLYSPWSRGRHIYFYQSSSLWWTETVGTILSIH